MSDPLFSHEQDARGRAEYEAALRHRRFDDPDRTHVVMGVYTTDLDEGRGDVYVAVGLGRYLSRLGYEVVYLHREDWYDPPEGTDLFLSMLAERTVMLDPWRLDPSIRRVAWCRNNTERWIASPHLAVYDAVLASSARSQRELREVYPGPTGILRIGVDAELFTPDGAPDDGRTGVLSTVNQWGKERQLYEALRRTERDYPLEIVGVQKGIAKELEPYVRDPAPYFAVPSLYRQAALVLDDQQDVNRGFGNVNSRIYESLACGALPITNTRLGLRDVELGEVPVYATPDELRTTVRGLLDDGPRRRDLVDRLRRIVLDQHSYEARAAQVDGFLDEVGLKGRVGQRPRGASSAAASFPVVGFLPDYRETNPYQDMLNARLVDRGIGAVPVPSFDRIGQASRLLTDRLVLHVQWTAPVLGPADSHADAQARLRRFLDDVDQVRRHGGRVVWTVHNLLPHECEYPDLETDLRQGLADRADAIHVMCDDTIRLAAEHYELPDDRTHVIRHSSYVDVYPNVVPRSRARDELGIAADATVVLAFGQVRPYKGLESLLDAVAALRETRPDLRLLIAGNPGRDPASRDLAAAIQNADGVDAHLRIVPDEELQVFVNAADLLVLPYRTALNSGALHMALTFGRPVVAASVGCLPNALSDETGVTFDPEDGDLAAALDTAIDRFAGERRAATERACYAAARRYDHLDMAGDFADLLVSLT